MKERYKRYEGHFLASNVRRSRYCHDIEKKFPILLVPLKYNPYFCKTLSLTFPIQLTYLWQPFVLVFVSFAKFQLLGFPDPTPTQPCSIPVLFPGSCTCFDCLCICFLPLSLTSRSSLSHASLAFLAQFLRPGDGELLRSMERVFKDLPTLFCSVQLLSCPLGHFPQESY